MCAVKKMYSFLRVGSLPSRIPMTLGALAAEMTPSLRVERQPHRRQALSAPNLLGA